MRMYYAAWKLPNGKTEVGIFENVPRRVFMRDVHKLGDVLYAIPFSVPGKTYRARQDNLRQLAIDWQLADAEVGGGLSYGELADIGAFFCKTGRKLGLIREFKENGILC